MCKKQTSVSHSSTDSEIISSDVGLRMDGIPALDLWDLIVAVLHGNTYQKDQERRDPSKSPARKKIHGKIDDLDSVELVPSNVQFFSWGSFVVNLWRQRSSDQDDHKRKKPCNETCFQNPQSCSWLVVWWNQFGPQDPNQVLWHQEPTRRHIDKGKLHTWWMESSFVFVQHQPFQFHQLSWSDVEKNARRCRWRKSHSKIKADDEFGLAMQRKESLSACLYGIRKPGEKQDTWNEQQPRTGRLVSDKFVIDIDMDSDTATESNLCLKSRSFLNRVNDRLRKMLNRSPEDSMQDIDKRSMVQGMFMSSTVDASVFMGKNYSGNLQSIKNYKGKISLWNRCSTYLKSW